MAPQSASAREPGLRRVVRRAVVLVVLLALAILAGACLGRITWDRVVARVTEAPSEALGLPLHASRPFWLLRTEPGWCGAHEVRFGGDPADPAVATIRAARFRNAAAADRAFSQLTSQHLALLLRDRITWAPRPVASSVAPRGDRFQVLEYGVRLPPEVPPWITLTGQLTSVQAGPIVILVESIGVWPEPLGAALDAAVAAAVPARGC